MKCLNKVGSKLHRWWGSSEFNIHLEYFVQVFSDLRHGTARDGAAVRYVVRLRPCLSVTDQELVKPAAEL